MHIWQPVVRAWNAILFIKLAFERGFFHVSIDCHKNKGTYNRLQGAVYFYAKTQFIRLGVKAFLTNKIT